MGKRRFVWRVGQAQVEDPCLARLNVLAVQSSDLGPLLIGVDGIRLPVDDVAMKAVLGIRMMVLLAVETLGIRFVLGEQQIRRAFCVEVVGTCFWVYGFHGHHVTWALYLPQERLPDNVAHRPSLVAPAPGIAVPQRGQRVARGCFWTSVCDADADKDIVFVGFGIFDQDVKVALLVKDARVEQLILGTCTPAPGVFRDEVSVRELALRVFV